MDPEREIFHATNYKAYVWVWLGLILLTGTTASLAGMDLGQWNVFIALAIAGTKSGLVLSYFMHLRSEKLTIFKILIPLIMAVLLVFHELFVNRIPQNRGPHGPELFLHRRVHHTRVNGIDLNVERLEFL